LLTPCIDYVVAFTHLGKAESRLVLAATPVLLLLQLILLPLDLGIMTGGESGVVIAIAPFVDKWNAGYLKCADLRRRP